jgi:hypothetical protein
VTRPRFAVHDALALIGGAALATSPFLPWVRIGSVLMKGIPDPAALFVLALGLAALVVSVVSAISRRRAPYALLLIGLAALTTLAVVWRTGPAAVALRAQARAEAVALVDNVPVQPVPAVSAAAGLYVGIAGALLVAVVGISGGRRDGRPPERASY